MLQDMQHAVDVGRVVRDAQRAPDHLGHPLAGPHLAAKAVRLRPADAVARYNLGNILAGLGRLDDAAVQFREALRLNPGLREARVRLERLAGERARSAR